MLNANDPELLSRRLILLLVREMLRRGLLPALYPVENLPVSIQDAPPIYG